MANNMNEEAKKKAIDLIVYSEKYYDKVHVSLPPVLTQLIPKNRLMRESEWRSVGIQQSLGWVHYMIHAPEPHVILFRRLLPVQQPRPN